MGLIWHTTPTLDLYSYAGLESAKADALALMAWKVKSLARIANGWLMNTDTMGVYGNYYLKRAVVAQLGLGANLQEDAVYPMTFTDDSGKPLDGANKYVLHFDNVASAFDISDRDATWGDRHDFAKIS